MFDTNVFKKSVKDWMRMNPTGSDQELVDFCEEQIPARQFAANQWLIDQTVSWYRHVLAQREMSNQSLDDDDADVA